MPVKLTATATAAEVPEPTLGASVLTEQVYSSDLTHSNFSAAAYPSILPPATVAYGQPSAD